MLCPVVNINLLSKCFLLFDFSMKSNMYMGRKEGSSMYQKWYYEVIIDHIEQVTHQTPHIRIGWANTDGFGAYPGGGYGWGANGVGDDLFSYGFDSMHLWTGE